MTYCVPTFTMMKTEFDTRITADKLVAITSRNDNLDLRGRTPKLTAIILAMLPSARVALSWDENGSPTKIARLVYTAPFQTMLKYLDIPDFPDGKSKKYPRPDGSVSTHLSKPTADVVPWYAYDALPDAEADTLKDMIPAFVYRFQRPLLSARDADSSLPSTRDELKKMLFTAMYSSLVAMEIPTSKAAKAMSECALDFELRAQEDALLDVYWPSSSVPLPMQAFSKIGGFSFLGQGQRCRDCFKSVTFSSLNHVDVPHLVRKLDQAVHDHAVVVDVWQHDALWEPIEGAGKMVFKLQEVKALLLLRDAQTKAHDNIEKIIKESDVHRALEELPGYVEVAPGRFSRLVYPERISRCSRCFKKECHSAWCSIKCSKCGVRHDPLESHVWPVTFSEDDVFHDGERSLDAEHRQDADGSDDEHDSLDDEDPDNFFILDDLQLQQIRQHHHGD